MKQVAFAGVRNLKTPFNVTKKPLKDEHDF